MVLRRARRAAALLPVLLVLSLASCGGGDRPDVVSAGAPGGAGQAVPTSAPAATSTTGAPAAPSTTVVAAAAAGDDPSPVAGVTAAELAAAVAAPTRGATRALGGPTLDRVPVGAATGWRVRVPSDAPVRAARVEVLVGERVVGQAVPTTDLDALVAVTLDGTGLRAGAPVALRWEGSEPVAVGSLAVIR